MRCTWVTCSGTMMTPGIPTTVRASISPFFTRGAFMTPKHARIQGNTGIFTPARKTLNSSVPAQVLSREVLADVDPAERG